MSNTTAPILLIGRNGQVARALQRLVDQQASERPLLVMGRPALDLAAALSEPQVLLAQLSTLLHDQRPALVVNAAAYTAVDKAESEPELAGAINGTAVGLLARTCAANAIPWCTSPPTMCSTAAAASPGMRTTPPARSASTAPASSPVSRPCALSGGDHLLLRVSWVFGQEGANFVRTMLRVGRERESLSIVDDQIGGPTSAEAIARTVLALAEPAIAGRSPLEPASPFPWGTYHFAAQPPVSWHGFATEIFRQAIDLGLIERAPELKAIPTSDYPLPAARPANSRLACDRFTTSFGLPLPDWREDLRHCLQAWAAATPTHSSVPANQP
jgi:dTDP-4-dehydrorhamnose reductase